MVRPPSKDFHISVCVANTKTLSMLKVPRLFHAILIRELKARFLAIEIIDF